MKRTYGVGLSNGSCIFDMATGFESIEEALSWGLGRGDAYNIFIDIDGKEDGIPCDPINCDYDNNLSWFDGWKWVDLTFDEAVKFLRRYL